jgi:hypothetical protein
MPLYLVSDGKGIAIVDSENEMFAKCDVIDTAYVDEPSELQATEIDLTQFQNGVMFIRSFKDGSSQI